MKRILMVTAVLALASCSTDEPPPAAAAPRKRAPSSAPGGGAAEGRLAPAPAPAMPAALPPEPAPVKPPSSPEKPPDPPTALSESPRPKPLEEARPPATPPPSPRATGLSGNIHLPAFTFRSLAGAGQVQINGELLGSTPCLWSITEGLAFDPKIRVDAWPPEGAIPIGTTAHPEKGSAEVWLDQADKLPSRFSHLRPGEAVLYVNGKVGGREIRGALRLLVEGYKYVVYTPLVNPEGEEASRYLRTFWLDRKQNE